MNTLFNTLFRNSLTPPNPTPGNELVLHQGSSTNPIVLVQEPVSPSLVSNLEKMCNELDHTTTSFSEAFPKYDPNTEIFVFRAFKVAFKFFKDLSSEQRELIGSKHISAEVSNNLLTRDTIIDKVPENIASNVLDCYNALGVYKPLGTLGDYTLNEVVMAAYNLNPEILMHLNDVNVSVLPLKIISAGLLYKTIVNSYVRVVYPMSFLETLEDSVQKELWLNSRKKNITLFMLTYAPFITFTLFKSCNSNLLDAFKIEVLNNESPILSQSILSLFFIPKKKSNYIYK